jgi:hypothetical protein
MSTTAILPGTFENVDRRVLAAFRCVDSITGRTVTAPLSVVSEQLTLRQNRSGTWIVFNGPGLSQLTNSFLAPGTVPAPAPFAMTIQDASGHYLSRTATINVPAPLTPASDAASIFNPKLVTLYATASVALGANWAVVRVSVTSAGTTPAHGLGSAMVRVTRTSDNAILATGMTDSRGEALLAVPGLGVRVGSTVDSAVLEATTAVTVQAYFDTSLLAKTKTLPDPDALLGNLNGASVRTAAQTAELGAGVSVAMSFSIAV